MMQTISAIPLLSQLPPKQLEPLLSDCQIYLKNYTKGTTVYNQKDHCCTFDIVISGSLVVYSLSETGAATTMFEFSAGNMLGANLLFSDTPAYPFTIYCLDDAQVLHITKEAVSALLHDYSFTMQFIGMLSLNSQKLNQKITMATQKTLRKNFLEYLQQQSTLQHSDTIILPISKKQLADYFGVQRPSLFREIKSLKDQGVITVANRTIRLNKKS